MSQRDILEAFYEVVNAKKPKASRIYLAASDIHPSVYHRKKKGKHVLLLELQEIFHNGQEPIIQKDSTSAWLNLATERFGLSVGDIRKMKFGQQMHVLFMDRNVGDYTSIKELGETFDPSKHGFSYGVYIHGEGLTGLLNFDRIGVIHAPFTWEINLAALKNQTAYWGPLDGCGSCEETKTMKAFNVADLDDDLLVGWRGSSIDMKNMSKLPRKITLYDTWWDDYGVTKYKDWLHKK